MPIFLSTQIQLYMKVDKDSFFCTVIDWVCRTYIGGCQAIFYMVEYKFCTLERLNQIKCCWEFVVNGLDELLGWFGVCRCLECSGMNASFYLNGFMCGWDFLEVLIVLKCRPN